MINKKNNDKFVDYQLISLLNATEGIYASWMRNMIILIGAGLTILKIENIFPQETIDMNFIKIKIKHTISILLITIGSIIGIVAYINYRERIDTLKTNNKNIIYDVYTNDRYMWILSFFINLIYIFLLIYIYKAFIQTF